MAFRPSFYSSRSDPVEPFCRVYTLANSCDNQIDFSSGNINTLKTSLCDVPLDDGA